MGKRSTAFKKQHRSGLGMGALAGVISAGVLFASAELVAAFFGPVTSPLTSVGSTFIDFTPGWLKNFAIATFGTNDKMVLLLSMGVVAAVLSAVAGQVARKSIRTAMGLVFAFAIVMAACILPRSGAGPLDLFPLLLGTATGMWALRFLSSTKSNAAEPTTDETLSSQPGAPSRRLFFIRSATLAGVAAVAGFGGNVLSATRNTARAFRQALILPAPKVTAAALAAGVQAPVDGVSPFVSPPQCGLLPYRYGLDRS